MTFEEQREFTNRENKFMRHCGIRIACLEPEICRAELSVEEYCKNTGTTVHGGLLYTMADCAVSAFARALGGGPVTLSGEFHYLSNVSEGTIAAEATPIRLGKTVRVFRAKVYSGEKQLAEGTFTCYAAKV